MRHMDSMENDRGESLVHKFSVDDVKTIELNKVMHGREVSKVTMASIEVPKEIQYTLPQFQEDFEIYVKQRKIVFKSNNLFAVFSK